MTAPDVLAPDVLAPDVLAPDVTAPDVMTPDVSAPDVIEPDGFAPDVVAPDAIVPPTCAVDLSPGPSTVSVCGESISVRNPALTPAQTFTVPWAGAPSAGAEIASRVCALVVAPSDGVFYFASTSGQFHAYARTFDGHWYDVSRASSWSVSSNDRERSYRVDATGLVTRTEIRLTGDLDLSVNPVTADFAGLRATRNWNVSGHYFIAPYQVRGPATARACSPVQLSLDIIDVVGITRSDAFLPTELPTYVRFTVSDPTIAAVSETGVLVGLRPGTVTVSAVATYLRCHIDMCERQQAEFPLTITITDGDSDAGGAADAAADATPDAATTDVTATDGEPEDAATADATVDAPADATPPPWDAPEPDAFVDAGADVATDALVDAPTDASIDADGGSYDGGLGTVYFCGGAVVLANPAGTREQFFSRPWDGAAVAGAEIAASVVEVRVVPEDGLWGYWSERARMRAVARTESGRWYDVTAVASWSVATDDRRWPYWIAAPGVAARGPVRSSVTYDDARITVAATLGVRSGSARWNVMGHHFPTPIGFSSTELAVEPCVPTPLEAVYGLSDGATAGGLDGASLRALFAITVSDPSIVAVGDTGLLVGLRPGVATVSLTTRVPYCSIDARECAYVEATRPLRVTVRP